MEEEESELEEASRWAKRLEQAWAEKFDLQQVDQIKLRQWRRPATQMKLPKIASQPAYGRGACDKKPLCGQIVSSEFLPAQKVMCRVQREL